MPASLRAAPRSEAPARSHPSPLQPLAAALLIAVALTGFGPHASARPRRTTSSETHDAADAGWTSQLAPKVRGALKGFDGELSLYVRDGQSGEELAWDADTPTYLSSAIKIVVMLEVLREVDARELSLDEPIVFGADDVRDGVGPIGEGTPGRHFTVAELLELMMDHSDNAAADMLMGRVGVDALNRLPASRGIEFGRIDTLLGERRRIYAHLDPRGARLTPRQILELGRCSTVDSRAELFSQMVGRIPALTGLQLEAAFQAFYAERVNSAPVRQVGALLDQIARCQGLTPSSCRRAHTLLRGCQTGRGRIRAGVPKRIVWEHKTGTQERRACDVGILRLRPDRTVVVAACVRDFWDVRDAERLFAAIGRAVWSALGSAEASDALDPGASPGPAIGRPRRAAQGSGPRAAAPRPVAARVHRRLRAGAPAPSGWALTAKKGAGRVGGGPVPGPGRAPRGARRRAQSVPRSITPRALPRPYR